MSRVITILAAASVLAGCAAGSVPATGARSTTASGSGASADGAGAVFPGQPAPAARATAALIVQSRAERDAGNLGGAAATIERALSIAPEDALLWIELAEIRLAQGDRQLAEEVARKALTLTNTNSPLAARAHRLITR